MNLPKLSKIINPIQINTNLICKIVTNYKSNSALGDVLSKQIDSDG